MCQLVVKEDKKADVIIVGSGLAGLVASLEVEKRGGRVLLVSRNSLGRGTCTSWSVGAFTVASETFSPKEHRERTLTCGHFMNNETLVEKLVQEAPGLLQEISKEYGVKLEKKGKTGYRVVVDRGLPGMGLVTPLVERLREKERIIPLERCILLSILKENGVVKGALVLSSKGEIYRLAGKALILATGGYSGLFSRNDNPPGINGMGLIQGALAGAGLINLEFVQFFPLGFAQEGLPDFCLPSSYPPSLRLYNNKGEDILEKYFPAGEDLNIVSTQYRDLLSRLMYQEILEGASFYLDLSPLSGDDWKDYFSTRLLKSYRHFKGDRVGVAPVAHYTMGGLAMDSSFCGGVKGLYGAGEAVGGFHGANRLGGNALSACLVSGYQAGVMALEENEEVLSSLGDNSFQSLERKGDEEIKDLQKTLKEEVGLYLGPIRSKDGLLTLSRLLNDLEGRINEVKVEEKDLWKFLDLKSSLILARLVNQGALNREESRGAHYREDFPETNEAFLKGDPVYLKKEGWRDENDAL